MKMNLGFKIGMGFFFLIFIILLVGILAIFQMSKVENNAARLTNEYIPEVDIATDIELNSLRTMYAMRGYSLSGDEKIFH